MIRRSFIVAVALAVTPPVTATGEALRIVAHPSVGGAQVKRSTLAALFLNRATAAADALAIVPVDQSTKSPVRASFSAEVLAQPIAAVQIHWMKQLAQGARPPVVKGSDAEVLAYVAATPGAIGYIAQSTPIDAGVKEIQVVD